MDDVRIEDGHIGQFRQDPNNARIHTPRNIAMIEQALSEVGSGRSIVATRDGYIPAGNGVIEAAAAAGIEEAIIVHTRGDRLLIHVRDDLDISDPLTSRLALYDNRAGELSKWNTDILAAMQDTEVISRLFSEQELHAVIEDMTPPGAPTPSDREPLSPDVVYRVQVEFDSEDEQLEFLEEMEDRGLKARPLTVG